MWNQRVSYEVEGQIFALPFESIKNCPLSAYILLKMLNSTIW